MAKSRSAKKVLVTAWIHNDLKEAAKQVAGAEGCADVQSLVAKLLREVCQKHGVKLGKAALAD